MHVTCKAARSKREGNLGKSGEDNDGGENAGICGGPRSGPFYVSYTSTLERADQMIFPPGDPRRWDFRERVRGSASPPRRGETASVGGSDCVARVFTTKSCNISAHQPRAFAS